MLTIAQAFSATNQPVEEDYFADHVATVTYKMGWHGGKPDE